MSAVRSVERPVTEIDRLHAVRSEGRLLDVEDMTVSYGTARGAVVAVDRASFWIDRGERVALVGESGSGKTSLGLAIGGYAHLAGATVEASRVRLLDAEIPASAQHGSRIPRATPGVSMVFQNAMTSLDPVWTIGSQFVSALRREGGRNRRRTLGLARDWLRRVGLHDTDRVLKARPYELSGGMRQRVMVALALCRQPALLVADEPTSALDASLSRSVMELLSELSRELGVSLLMVSHDIALCREYSDRVIVMYRGALLEQLPSARLEAAATHPYTRGLLQCIPTLAHAQDPVLPTLASFEARERELVEHAG